jgi:hypothetical protein
LRRRWRGVAERRRRNGRRRWRRRVRSQGAVGRAVVLVVRRRRSVGWSEGVAVGRHDGRAVVGGVVVIEQKVSWPQHSRSC